MQGFVLPNGVHHHHSSLGHHHLDELLVVDLAIAIDISLTDHLVDLLIGQLLAEVGHDVAELGSGDETILVLVEHPERLLELFLRVGVLHLASHEVEELREVDGAIAVSINLVDHVLKLSLGWILTQRTHDSSQLLGCDATCPMSNRDQLQSEDFEYFISHPTMQPK
jgi:hypothetical protein